MQELGIGLPGVDDQGDLTQFQRWALLFALEERHKELEEQTGAPSSTTGQPQLNSRRKPNGGGKIVEQKKFINESAATGKDPDELIKDNSD